MEKIGSEIYKMLFENIAEGLVIVDNKGIIELINPRIEEMFGYSENELKGKPVEILIPDSLKSKHEYHRATYTKRPVQRSMGKNMELKGKKKNGDHLNVEISLNHVKLESGLKVIALISDITERVKAQNEIKNLNVELENRVELRTVELEKSQKLYKLISKNFPNGTINVFDNKLNYVFVEGQELSKYGITGDKLIGTNYLDRLDPKIGKDIEKKLQQVFEGKSVSFEIEHEESHYVINAVPLRTTAGKIDQILVIEKNITASKLAQKEIKKMLEREKQLNELKSRFVSMASHEFRTPLSTILSSTTLAQKYCSPEQEEKRLKHLNRIKSSVKNLTSILNDFLSIDKLEAGKVHVNITSFNLQELIEEVIEEMGTYLKDGQKIENNCSIEQKEISTDRNVLKNVLINLLSNASKYSGNDKTITLYISQKKNQPFHIEVVDQGIGIPLEEQKHLFERFFRAKNVTNIQGTGLGLNIVKKYIDIIKGDISFESTPEVGTKFLIEIPNTPK